MRLIIILFIQLSYLSVYTQGQPTTKVIIHEKINYSEYENFADEAALILEKVINSDRFKEAILNGKFIRTNNLNNQELYEAIMKANERQGIGGQDYVIDLRVRTLEINDSESRWKKKCEIGSRTGTIGIDGNGDGVTAICPQRLEYWFKNNEVSKLAGHYAHEYTHILGFNHRKKINTARWRSKTFVYKVGKIVTDLSKEFLGNS